MILDTPGKEGKHMATLADILAAIQATAKALEAFVLSYREDGLAEIESREEQEVSKE